MTTDFTVGGEFSAFQRIAHLSRSKSSLETVFKELVESVRGSLEAKSASLFVADGVESNRLLRLSSSGKGSVSSRSWINADGYPDVSQAVKTSKPVLVSCEKTTGRSSRSFSRLIVPFRTHGKRVGVVWIEGARMNVDLGKKGILVAQVFSGLAALILDKKEWEDEVKSLRAEFARFNREMSTSRRRLDREVRAVREDLRLQIHRLAILYQVAGILSSTVDMDRALEAIVREAAHHLRAVKASVMLVREGSDTMVINAAVGLKEWVVKRCRVSIGEGISGRVAAEGKPILVTDIESDSRFARRRKSTYRTGSLISVPMIMAGRVLGVMNVADKRGGESFNQQDLELLCALADQGAVAVHRARLFSEVLGQKNRLADLSGRLEAERSKIALVLTSIADGVVAVGIDGEIITVNPAATAWLGESPNNLIGRFLLPGPGNTPLLNVLAEHHRRAFRGEAISEVTAVGFGEKADQYVEISTGPLKSPDMPIVGTVSILHDVTELKRLDEMKTEFVSRASHELRTPIGIIMGLLETIQAHQDLDPVKVSHFLDLSLKETNRLADLTKALLDLSRLQSGSKILRKVPVDLGEAAIEVSRELRPRAREAGLILSCRRLSPETVAFADPQAVRQIFRNLISNALKFTPRGGKIAVTIGFRHHQAEVIIKDTGVGIAAEHLPRVFDKFYRGSQEYSGISGTGLGLSIVKELIESMEGMIAIKSAPGQGTSVAIRLPVGGMEENENHPDCG